MTNYKIQKRILATREAANSVIALYNEERLAELDQPEVKTTLSAIVEQANSTLKISPMQLPTSDPYRSIGRNQKVTLEDEIGNQSVSKFKLVEHAIRSGKLKIVTIHPR